MGDTEDSCAGLPTASMTSLPHKKKIVIKTPFPLRNGLAQPNTDTSELVTGKESINQCPVLQISSHVSLP